MEKIIAPESKSYAPRRITLKDLGRNESFFNGKVQSNESSTDKTKNSSLNFRSSFSRIAFEDFDALTFCPNILFEDFPRTRFTSKPCSEAFECTVLLADISGFSAFAGKMCLQGAKGLDLLRGVTNNFLGTIVEKVYVHGGDVMAFAGDALICIFRTKSRNCSDSDIGSDLAAPTLSIDSSGTANAIACAWELKDHETHSLKGHFGISCGTVKIASLGGVDDRWIYLMNGPCVSQLKMCLDAAGPQEVVCTKECFEKAVAANPSIFSMGSIVDDVPIVKVGLKSLGDPSAGSTSSGILLAAISTRRPSFQEEKFNDVKSSPHSLMPVLDEESFIDRMKKSFDFPTILAEAGCYLPLPVMPAIMSGSSEGTSELRKVTTMFLSLDSYDQDVHSDPLSLQPFLLLLQEVLKETGGFLRQFLVDDKGCVAIAMWGVPSFTHANDCSRGLYCAFSMSTRVAEIGHRCSIGLTTGYAYCGIIGSEIRRDYVCIGDKVNIAARLMGKSKGRVLIDPDIYNQVSEDEKSLLAPDAELYLKGVEGPFLPYKFIPFADLGTLRQKSQDFMADRKDILLRAAADAVTILLKKVLRCKSTSSLDYCAKAEDDMFANFYRSFLLVGAPLSVGREYIMPGDYVPVCVFQTSVNGSGIESSIGLLKTAATALLISTVHVSCAADDENKRFSTLKRIMVSINDVSERKSTLKSNQSQRYSQRRQSLSYTKQRLGDVVDEVITKFMMLEASDISESVVGYIRQFFDPSFTGTASPSFKVEKSDHIYLVFMGILQDLLAEKSCVVVLDHAQFCDLGTWAFIEYLQIQAKFKGLGMLIKLHVRSTINLISRKQSFKQKSLSNITQAESLEAYRRSLRNLMCFGSAEEELEAELSRKVGAEHLYRKDRYEGLKINTERKSDRNYIQSRNFTAIKQQSGIVVDRAELSAEEVGEVLTQVLKVDSLSEDFVSRVATITSGHAYWVASVAQYIAHHGTQQFLELAKEEVEVVSDPLTQLVAIQLETACSSDLQLILKYASVLGEEFTAVMLQAVLPENLTTIMSYELTTAIEEGLITSVESDPLVIYGFGNSLMRELLYNRIPPSEAALIHQTAGKYLEVKYENNLGPFYISLSYHFGVSKLHPTKSFEYMIEGAKLAIRHDDFEDAIALLNIAWTLSQGSSVEKERLKTVVDRGIDRYLGVKGRCDLVGINDGESFNIAAFPSSTALVDSVLLTCFYDLKACVDSSKNAASAKARLKPIVSSMMSLFVSSEASHDKQGAKSPRSPVSRSFSNKHSFHSLHSVNEDEHPSLTNREKPPVETARLSGPSSTATIVPLSGGVEDTSTSRAKENGVKQKQRLCFIM